MAADFETKEGQIVFSCPNCQAFNRFQIIERETTCICGSNFVLRLIEDLRGV